MVVSQEIRQKLLPIKALIMDVDGVLTDGRIQIDDHGIESKAFNVRDGHGLKLLKRFDLKTVFLTGRHSRIVSNRARELNIDLVYQRCHNKLTAYHAILKRLSITNLQTAYIGDDIVDLPVLSQVGFSATVADADQEVLDSVHWISDYPGGSGAVRQLCQLILEAKGLWPEVMRRYRSNA